VEQLSRMLNPRTVALFGAREKEGTIGRTLLDNLCRSGQQKVYPVNPSTVSLLGSPCYPTAESIPEEIDLAVVAVRAEFVPYVAEDCGTAGVKGLLIVSAGFGDAGEEGRLLEVRLEAVRKRFGMRIVGPGSLGILRPPVGLNASFLKLDPAAGNIAFISQTGELGDAMLEWARDAGIGFSFFASLGRAIDVDFGDLIDLLGDDYGTRSILLDMERVTNARKFMSAARGFARSKPIIVVKPGRFKTPRNRPDEPADMADLVYDAAFKRVGLVRVKEARDLAAAAQVLDAARLPPGPRLAIITHAGTVGIMAKDALLELGGELARLSEETLQALDETLAPWNRSNPVAVPVEGTLEHYDTAVRFCLKDQGVDALLVIHLPRAVATPMELANALVVIAKGTSKPVLAAMMGGHESREAARILLQHNIPAYSTPEEAVKTYLHMHQYKRNLELLYETPEEISLDEIPEKQRFKALTHDAAIQGRTKLTAEQTLELLHQYGVPTVPAYTVTTEEQAWQTAQELGYPVVLKLATGLPAKRGGKRTVLGVASEDGLRSAYAALTRDIAHDVQKRTSEITIQKMLWSVQYQLILVVERDADFGAVIRFGTGGVGHDLFHDYSIALPPLNQALARRLIEETKAYDMLLGYRGRPPVDIRQLERMLVSVSNLIVDFPEIVSLEMDPMAVVEDRVLVLGAAMAIAPTPAGRRTSYPHLVITPYPARYTTRWRLKDGAEVVLRSIRPEDEPLEHDMLTSLSEETLRERFFSPMNEWTHDTLVRFCNIDYGREVAIVAEPVGEKRIIGIGRLVIQPDLTSSEFAVLVHDRLQGQGLGYKLVNLLIGIAREKGLDEIVGTVLSDNERMLRLCRRLGFTTRLAPSGVSKAILRLDSEQGRTTESN